MKKLIELINIEVKYKDAYNLKNISFSISNGEKVALLGESGSGKTTLINVINGSIKSNKGEILFKGKYFNKLTRKELQKIGTIWQDLRLINELNVAQNINTGALGKHNLFWALRNLMGIIDEDICKEYLKLMNLRENLLNSPINKISGGQRQRVAIARLLRQQPELVLADEPISNLDPKTSKDMLTLLLNNSNNNIIKIPKTYLISLHRPELIKKYFTRVIGLKKGYIEFDLPTKNISNSLINNLYKK